MSTLIEVKIRWGSAGESTKTYQFETEEQKAFFMKGVDEAEGWLEDHATLPASYVKSCQEFFDELKENQNRHVLIAGAVEKRQAASGKPELTSSKQQDITKLESEN